MNGLFSRTPHPVTVRSLVGSHLLLIVQAFLVAYAGDPADPMLRGICVVILVIGVAGLILGALGCASDDRPAWHARRSRPAGVRP